MTAGAGVRFLVQDVPDAFRGRAELRNWLARVAKDQGHELGSIAYVLMSDEQLLAYNRSYLDHHDLTDVITFPDADNEGVSGDVLISYERVKENARTFKVSAQHELARVIVHGLLHLIGHSDKSHAQRAAMTALEDRYLALRSSVGRSK